MIFSYLKEILVKERKPLIVAAAAVALYLPAIWWGLPHATHPLGVHGWDIDAVTGMQTLSELHNLFIEPKTNWYLAYPLFHYLVVGFFYAPYFVFLYLSGGISQPTAIYPFGFTDPVAALKHLALIGRAITVVMASGVVVNAYLTARTVWDERTAQLTAIAAALPVPMFYYARTGNIDIPVLFWMSCSILVMAKCVMSGLTIRRAVWLGVFSALAVATKDQAYGPLTVGLIGIVIIHIWKNTPDTGTASRWKAPAALIVSGLLAFSITSGLVMSPQRFFGHLSFIRNFEKTFDFLLRMDALHPATPLGYSTLMLDLLTQLTIAIGPILFVVAIIGIAIAVRSSPFPRILLAMLLGYTVLVILPIRFMQYRYTMLPAFVFALFIGRAFAVGLQMESRQIRTGMMILLVAGFGWLGLRDIDLTYQMLFDARYEAGEWIAANSRPSDKIAYFNTGSSIQLYAKSETPFVSTANPEEVKQAEAEERAVWLLDDPSPVEKLAGENVRFVLAQPDFSSEIGWKRSRFFPESLYAQMNDGSLGYRKAASFETRPLFTGFLLDLPLVGPGYIVNAPVEVFEKVAAR